MKKTVFVRRMLFALVNSAAAAVLLALYASGAAAVETFAAQSGLELAAGLYHFAFAALPAAYLRLLVAWMRRGMYKGKKLQWEVDLAGAAAAVLLVAAGLAGYFLRVDLLARDVRVYYFVALWLAALCSAQRVPRRAAPAPDDREPAPMPWPEVPALHETADAAREGAGMAADAAQGAVCPDADDASFAGMPEDDAGGNAGKAADGPDASRTPGSPSSGEPA